MVVIGLTGGIATGKSTVSRLLRQAGAVVFDADLAARQVLLPGEPAWQVLSTVEGGKYIMASGEVDRTALAARVFSDTVFRDWINGLTHERIRAAAEQFLAEQEQLGTAVVVLDVPLLFEAHWEALADEIWVVAADEATQCRRLMARDGIDEASARRKMSTQWPLAQKVKHAQVVFNNNGDQQALAESVNRAWQVLQNRLHEGGKA